MRIGWEQLEDDVEYDNASYDFVEESSRTIQRRHDDYSVHRDFAWGYSMRPTFPSPLINSPFTSLTRLVFPLTSLEFDEDDSNNAPPVLIFFTRLFPSLRQLTVTAFETHYLSELGYLILRRSVTRFALSARIQANQTLTVPIQAFHRCHYSWRERHPSPSSKRRYPSYRPLARPTARRARNVAPPRVRRVGAV